MADKSVRGTADVTDGGNSQVLSRRSILRMSLLGSSALFAGPALAACGTSSGGSGSTASQNVTIGVVGDMVNFDPYYNGTVDFILLQNLNTFLIDYDDKLKPQPAALTSWEISSDHTQVTLKLRPNLKLQTGKTWTADDLVQGFKRAADPAEGQQLNGPMAIVKDYKATDSSTVVLTFNQPVPELLITDLLESFPAVDSADNSSKELASKPASGGPFQLVSRDPGNDVVISRWPDYWNAKNVHLEKVTFRIFDNADAMVGALQSGALDAAYSLPAKNASQLKNQYAIVKGYPGALVQCLRINVNTAPWDNIKLRQAVSRALDRERIAREVYFGYSVPLYLPWGPDSPANDRSYAKMNSFDLNAAKQLWQEAGSPAGAEALADGSDADALQMLQILQQDLKQIGFDLKITTVDKATFTKRLLAGDFGILFGAIGNSSKSPSRVDTNSIFRIVKNPVLKDKVPQEYIDAIKASERAVTPDQAKAAYAQLNKVITEQAFGIPVCDMPTLTATKKSLTGVTRDVDNRLVLEGAKVS
ncbi:ABC transporter substrate-binding protein [Planosporangium thailandense]|uniref:ABC transporter substrate-binding protein n=1 Tax=Planosporangium thailandense TaxID=765197 RepID=A0ABX0Y459_9ACTN|nr:ABC transporter substrate-binding protein [Planosporangium thailandense]NJC72922.1 ABC transporter substrate-binding protein [Planosporangium thailandense]